MKQKTRHVDGGCRVSADGAVRAGGAKQNSSTPRLPLSSPTRVLVWRNRTWLPRADESGYVYSAMIEPCLLTYSPPIRTPLPPGQTLSFISHHRGSCHPIFANLRLSTHNRHAFIILKTLQTPIINNCIHKVTKHDDRLHLSDTPNPKYSRAYSSEYTPFAFWCTTIPTIQARIWYSRHFQNVAPIIIHQAHRSILHRASWPSSYGVTLNPIMMGRFLRLHFI